ncbi:Gmad2 immunoglobulin-like domain-containing protein [Lentzea sp. NEAU-D7]|uniref:Gmad2 immunoglobulin-like domain-containing protein n=1 Tax=Lentzea sp. NEAU-D7 TaxID=2994667 RepID=UPI00224AF641|nr:Gmad2 immunoglobulin-like domain-containing protein [Lentzea sp. NEAU-D7]MCX2951472.1 Gmad2 immunoglobulin-like domain-containing protein [Lentzea sp. NEAU-D7]
MRRFGSRRRLWLVVSVVIGVVVLLGGVLVALKVGRPGPPVATGTTSPTTSAPSATTAPSGGESTTVSVYFHRGGLDDPGKVVAVPRTVPRTRMVATAALNELLPGPTAAEHEAGYWSMFVPATARTLKSVRIADGVAHADFTNFSTVIPNASSSAGSAALLAELDSTLKQFPTVKSTVYSFDGDVAAFYHWLQLTPPGTPGDQAGALAAGKRFLVDVAGVRAAFEGPFRWTGDGTAEATYYPPSPNDGTQPVRTLPTVVGLQRAGGQWWVTGARSEVIQVDAPKSGQTVSSPLALSGRAHVFEGNVTVRVVTEQDGGTTEIAKSFVTGGGDALRPFQGEISFPQPLNGNGWVLFQEYSAANGEVVLTTAVRVNF